MHTAADGIRFQLLTPANPSLDLLIFIPGLDGSDLSIKHQLDGLKSKFEVGYLSISTDNKMSWDQLVRASTSLIQEVSTKMRSSSDRARTLCLCGESFGACLALAMAVGAPNEFGNLILINPATSYRNQVWSPLISVVVDQMPKAAYQLSTLILLPFLIVESRVTRDSKQSLLKAMQAFKPQDLSWRLSLLQKFHVPLDSLKIIDIPVLLVSASRDRLLPSDREVEKISTFISNSKIVRLEKSGHACLLEKTTDLGLIIKESGFN